MLLRDEDVRAAGRVLPLSGGVVGLEHAVEPERLPERRRRGVVAGLDVEAAEPLGRHDVEGTPRRKTAPMARLHDVVFNCSRPATLARFWAAALDGFEVAPYDEVELARLRALGVDDPEDDSSVLVERPGFSPRLFFQRVLEPRTVKNRVHLDLRPDDVDAEAARLVALGATIAATQENEALLVMHDPEGNEFCLLR